ncbi:hypothetical protein ACL00X_03540 [Aeromonas diversa]|uniref:hypothetical protein n=1 Tax=Aeromonas diversa TaxID=502790 RepID=UPI00399FECBB
MHVSNKPSRLMLAGAALLVSACTQQPRVAPAKPKPAVVEAPAVPSVDPNAKVQIEGVERLAFSEEYQGPAEGSLESVRALFGRGYVDSGLRETMLAAVRSDYPMLGMRDVRLTDPVRKFLTSERAAMTAHDYIRRGLEAHLGPISDARYRQIWQSLPQNGEVRHWSARIKQVMAKR